MCNVVIARRSRSNLLILGLSFCFLLSSKIATAKTQSGTQGSRLFELKNMDINNVELPLTTYGKFGQNAAGTAGGIWPKGSGCPYIFGAGMWIGALVGGEKLVTQGYNPMNGRSEFMPGPPEHNADHAANASSHPEDRLYFSTNSTDLAEWPLKDSLGQNIILSDQDVYCLYNDMWQAQHEETKPIGLIVKQLAFAWNAPVNNNIVFIQYAFKNVSSRTLRGMYVGADADMDIGNADNDLVGLDISRSLGYTYTVGQEPGWKYPPPYYVAFRFLQGPKASDTVYVGSLNGWNDPTGAIDTVFPGERLPMTAFKKCTRAVEPSNDNQRYDMLAGYDYTTGAYNPFGDSVDNVPGDKRMIQAAGPFRLAPGEEDTLLVAVMFSNGATGGLDYLRAEGDLAKAMFDAGWLFPGPPPPPELTVTPGDHKVTLTWDNSPENTPDAFYTKMQEIGDTLYLEYDFQGYRVWRSKTGFPGDWTLLGECDKADDIRMLPDELTPIDTAWASPNTGLKYSYVDNSVVNGFTYYYAVTSFDYNTTASPNVAEYTAQECSQGGKGMKTAVPRSEAANYIPPETPVEHTQGAANAVTVRADAKVPTAITGHAYEIRCQETQVNKNNLLPIYSFYIFDVTDGDTPVPVLTIPINTAQGMWTGKVVSPIFDGIEVSADVKVDPNTFGCDSIKVTNDIGTAYPGDSLKVGGFTGGGTEKWAFRGTNFEIRWKYYHGNPDTLTCEVWDIGNNIKVNFDTARVNSWSFNYSSIKPGRDFITGDTALIERNYRKGMYICGCLYYFNKPAANPLPMNWSVHPEDGEIWTVYNSGDKAPGAGNVFRINSKSFKFAGKGNLDNIRVVPNPLLVRNDWECSKDYSRLQFTHLPDECTIRIYTLAGDLIKTIEHKATISGQGVNTAGGTEWWDILTAEGRIPASGIYIYHIESKIGNKIGKFAIIK
ncbi:MAG: hypothetical protein QMD71_06140 [bacterium]|nr:hypothetical protein [bacterium]